MNVAMMFLGSYFFFSAGDKVVIGDGFCRAALRPILELAKNGDPLFPLLDMATGIF
jgi:hypothetical protein